MRSTLGTSRLLFGVAGYPLLLILAGCTTTAYKESADDAVYQIVAEVEEQIFGTASEFSIDTPKKD